MSGRPLAALWREARRPDGLRVRLLGTFTLDTVVPYLGVALHRLGIAADVAVGPFNQVVQECLDPGSETARAAPDVLVVWPRLEDLWGAPVAVPATPATREHLLRTVDVLCEAVGQHRGRLVVVLPPIPADRPLGVGDASAPHGVVALATAARERMRQRLTEPSGVVLCDADDAVRAVGEAVVYDRRLELLAALPYSHRFLAEAASLLARAIRLATRAPIKAVVLDADGTLWGGAVGELGPGGVDLGPGPAAAYLDFQRFLVALHGDGVLLTLCSKNLEEDVWAAFDRPDMVLRREHLSAWRIGWRPKREAIAELAEELGIGVDAVVFVDDNPAELAEAGAALPALTVVPMPADPVRWREVASAAAFDRPHASEDDRQRSRRIAQDQHRARLRTAMSPEEYLRELGVWAVCRRPAPADLSRLAQLLARTNQMNLNGRRLFEPELASLLTSPAHEMRLIEAGDSCGDYGQVGVFVLGIAGGQADLEVFALSCRALGRAVERMMLAEAFAVADQRGVPGITATVTELPRNEPARAFFAALGCAEPGVAAALTRPDSPAHIAVRHG